MSTEVVVFQATEAVIAELAVKYKDAVFDVATIEGMYLAKTSYKDINTHNLILEAARVHEKSESLAYGRRVDSEAKRIADQLDALRLPIKAQIEIETKRQEREREAVIKAEQERIAAEQRAIKEAEEQRVAVGRAEIARRQAELDAAERVRAEADRKARLEIEAQERAARSRIEATEQEARKGRQAEEDRLRAEREALDRAKREQEEKALVERREAERKERLAQQARDDVARQVRRQEAELADAKGMLTMFVARFGKIKEFAGVILAIKVYQSAK